MSTQKNLVLLLAILSTWITPGIAQISWSNRSPAGITDAIWCVTYANGTFAAVTDQGNLLTSTDGLTWSTQAIDYGVWLVSIAYGDGIWVVVGAYGTILVSPDLKTWTRADSPTTNRLNGVLFIPNAALGNYWVAVGEAGTILSSSDDIHWTSQLSGVSGSLHGITIDADFDVCGGKRGHPSGEGPHLGGQPEHLALQPVSRADDPIPGGHSYPADHAAGAELLLAVSLQSHRRG
jgi:hypothetical protein